MPKQIFDNDDEFLDYGDIDEMSAMGIGDRGYTNVYPLEGSGELLRDGFERRAHELQRDPSDLQPVQLVPMKRGPWSANNQFGIEQPFSAAANNNQTILKLPEWEFPQVWSVMLGATLSELSTASYDIIASIEAGVGGITDTFEVDWQQGIAFSVVANALNITARFGRTTSIPSDVRLRAMVGRRPLVASCPTRTFRTTAIDGGNSQRITIPKYAKSLTVLPGPAPNNNVYDPLMLYSITNSISSGFRLNMTGQQILQLGDGARIPIPGGGNFIRANNGTLATVDMTFVFELGL